jgi:arylsulfatase A-like enzyme
LTQDILGPYKRQWRGSHGCFFASVQILIKASKEEPVNIIVIIIDTLRYDHIGAHGNSWIKTPNMDALAERSWVFDRSFSASYPTIPHRTDVITGKYGSPFFPWKPLRFDHVTFPWLLAENGYCTQLIHDTPHLVNGGHNFDWPFHAWTQVRGAEGDRSWIDDGELKLDNTARDPLFDYVDKPAITWRNWATYVWSNRHRKKLKDWNAAKLFLTASRWLEENASRDNFFLWVDCFDPHEPWDVPPEFAVLYDADREWDGRIDPRSYFSQNNPELPDAARARIKALYAAKVSWMDRWLGELLDTLDHTGLSKKTAVLFTSDHGTKVGEWGKFGKGFPVREQEGHTPFMVSIPNGGSGRCDAFVQPQDVFATVLALARVPVPDGLDCRDAVALARGDRSRAREVALAGHAPTPENQRWKCFYTVFGEEYYLTSGLNLEDSQLIRYKTTEDVSGQNPAVVEKMHSQGIEEIQRRGADPAIVEWLRSYGELDFPEACRYWDGYPGPAGYTQYFKRRYFD